jgi:membrane dipeptidase
MRLAATPKDRFYFVLLTGVMACSVPGFAQNTPVSSRARSIQNSALVVDAHADTPQRFLDENYDIGSTDPKDEEYISLEKAKAGNLGAEFFSIWVNPKANQDHFAKRTLDLIDSVYEQASRHPDSMTMAFSVNDIERVHKEHKIAALMGIEGGHSIENDIRLLREYYRLGVRYMTLTWSNTNEWADSSGDLDDPNVKHHNGLTEFGKEVVLEMNRLGMIVDVSHISDKTFWDTIATTKAPVIASHSSARSLVNVRSNMSDDMLRAITNNGGVVCVNFFANFIDNDFLEAAKSQHQEMLAAVDNYVKERKAAGSQVTEDEWQRVASKWLAENRIRRAPLKSLIDHIDHLVKVAGVNHVGLGSDFDGRNYLPDGIDSAADLPQITQALLDRGYSSEDIKKILGGNVMRLFREVEQVSHDM